LESQVKYHLNAPLKWLAPSLTLKQLTSLEKTFQGETQKRI